MANLDSPERLLVLRGEVLAAERDPTLQAIVEEAAALANTPLAAITLIMERVQYFRAGLNLPPDLAVSLATSRCDSFCQFVVQSESSFVVTHASEDARIPKTVVNTYGVQAYFGVPLRVDEQVVGTLCVFDVAPREFDATLEAEFSRLALRASIRLEELARISEDLAASESASSAELADLVHFQARLLERALAELGPLVRIGQAISTGALSLEDAQRGASMLSEASPVFQLLIDESRRMSTMSGQLRGRLGGGG